MFFYADAGSHAGSRSADFQVMCIAWGDGQAHPGMDAALVFGVEFVIQRDGRGGTGPEEDVVRAGWLGDELSIDDLGALGGRHRIAR